MYKSLSPLHTLVPPRSNYSRHTPALRSDRKKEIRNKNYTVYINAVDRRTRCSNGPMMRLLVVYKGNETAREKKVAEMSDIYRSKSLLSRTDKNEKRNHAIYAMERSSSDVSARKG
ncbi:hypothetical protein CC80DRAFT_86769 [Byssothecium circinans]|uniref:Uncharacterized protein n=1 Tax=Byssothecium circinans TaxID=147558 RepID=A0A6A5TS82_9PLEO|nr:hypothetical protein CC80DRAFT_86769 [Byssothecium circinans]